MSKKNTKPFNILIEELRERAKELNCLYEVQETLNHSGIKTGDALKRIIEVIPAGWQYPEICQSEISFGESVFRSAGFKETPWVQHSDIIVQDQAAGRISVYYTEEKPVVDEGPFLDDERRLINTIADQVGNFILTRRLQDVFERKSKIGPENNAGWQVVLGLLQKTDPDLLVTVARKMVHHLCGLGIKEAEGLLELFSSAYREDRELLESNAPYQFKSDQDASNVIDQVYKLADLNLKNDEILDLIQQWIREDQSGFLVNTLVQPGRSVSDIIAALNKYTQLSSQGLELSAARKKSVQVALIRRLLSQQEKYITTAKKYINIEEFSDLSSNILYQSGNYGKLGGKSAGIFLAAEIINKSGLDKDLLHQIKTPKTWYIISDAIFSFIEYNNLEEIIEHKYLNIGEIRQEYPYIIQVFNNSPLPPDIVKGLSMALDDFGEVPLIVRSSSLLEDQVGMSFAGKYKSLFVANQGSKEERLEQLSDAIAEVYASMYGPDPIEYRSEHNLIDHHEEMGILIQEVVGRKIGPYYFPAYAGVAFSQNEFMWSSRIKKQDGLVRIVPGLGTRAVDRLSDDYPVLAAPGQPGLRVNTSLDEMIRYSPKMIDVINLTTGSFETINLKQLLKEFGSEYPNIKQLVSIITEDQAQIPAGLGPDFDKDFLVFSFDGLFSKTPFLAKLRAVLTELQEKLNHPVDIEFACDGDDFYLLQCRSQSYGDENVPAIIPTNVPQDKTIFTANRFISNGTISNISHIVYIDPEQYSQIPTKQEMHEIGRVVGRINKALPKRKFILMGPGRWGSRGDIKLGVSVTYSDINNTAALIEVAQKRGDYTPDLSFGTHFFQDLVESSIKYIPLYPDDKGIYFNFQFLQTSNNILSDILPDAAYLEGVIRVIDVNQSSPGNLLQILMNAEKNSAIALLLEQDQLALDQYLLKPLVAPSSEEDHWQWRLNCAERIAANLDPERFGVKGLYVFGSTKNATAGPQSDLDLLVHFVGTEVQLKDLQSWLEGWSQALGKVNQERTGAKAGELLDVAIVTDEDIKNRTSYAVKIGAVSDAAMPLSIGIK